MLRKCSAPTRRYAAIAAAISVATLFRTWLAHSPLPTVIRMSSFPRLDALPESFRKPTSTSAKQTRAFHDRVRYYVHGSDALVHDAAAPARAAAALGVTTAAPVTGTGEAEIEAERASGRLVVLNASMCEAGDSALANEIQRQLGPDSPVQRQGALGMYVADACAVAPPTSAAYLVGDIATCFSQTVFAKARPCGCTSTVLLDLNRNRHFEFYPVRIFTPGAVETGDGGLPLAHGVPKSVRRRCWHEQNALQRVKPRLIATILYYSHSRTNLMPKTRPGHTSCRSLCGVDRPQAFSRTRPWVRATTYSPGGRPRPTNVST